MIRKKVYRLAFEINQLATYGNFKNYIRAKNNKRGEMLKTVAKLLINSVKTQDNDNKKVSELFYGDENSNSPRFRELLKFTPNKNDRLVICSFYSPDNNLSRLQQKIIKDYKILGYKLIAVVTTDTYLNDYYQASTYEADSYIIVENKFFDFCSWSIALRNNKECGKAKEIILTNDSITSRINDTYLLKKAIRRIRDKSNDLCFLTRSNEVIQHGQSYFIYLSREGIKKGLLKYFEKGAQFRRKEDLINNIELKLCHHLKAKGYNIGFLYTLSGKKNPTLEYWDFLCKHDYPFIKISALGFAKAHFKSKKINKYLDNAILKLINEHISNRVGASIEKVPEYKSSFINQYNAIVSPRLDISPININCLEISVFYRSIKCKPLYTCILHAYYLDIAKEHITYLNNIGVPYELFITTNDTHKKKELELFCGGIGLNPTICVYKNTGRDILPLIQCIRNNKIDENLPVLHLHTKKSPHNKNIDLWPRHILQCLLGSRERVLSCIYSISNLNIGVIFPSYFKEINEQINWGHNLESSSYIAQKIGFEIDSEDYLEFPAGSMMWINKKIIDELANSSLSISDFEKEAGQVDGTMAHAIERIFLHLSLHLKLEYLQLGPINSIKKTKSDQNMKEFKTIKSLTEWGKSYVAPRLKRTLKSYLISNRGLTYDVEVLPDTSHRSRLNIILPTIEPKKIYGGISTALKCGKQMYDKGNFSSIRIIITTEATSIKAVTDLSKRYGVDFSFESSTATIEASSYQVCNLFTETDRLIRVGSNDKFLTTAWWTAHMGKSINEQRNKLYKSSQSMYYLIQDFECGFYEWGYNYVRAYNTYSDPSIIAIINSLPLYEFMVKSFDFRKSYLVPYSLNATLSRILDERSETIESYKENIILCYARPSTARNCYLIIIEALRYWSKKSEISKNWKIVLIGEEIDKNLFQGIPNCHCVGKLSLDEYADMLSMAKVGISLMISPHPSYPPLEMASFGMKVITNTYEERNLSTQSNNIYTLKNLDENSISQKLDELCRADNFKASEFREDVPSTINIFPTDFNEENSMDPSN